MLRNYSLALFSAALFLAVLSTSLHAKSEEWQDLQGVTFKGEPTESFGPLLFFRVGSTQGKRFLFRQLSPETCVRAYQILKNKPPRAADWAQARSAVSYDLFRNVMKPQGDKLVPVDVSGRPEPAFYIVLFASNGEGNSWAMLDAAIEPYKKLVAENPGVVEMVMFGVRHKRSEHANMACSKNVPFLVTDFEEQRSMSSISRFMPGEGYSMVVLSREGVLVGVTENPDYPTVQKTIQNISAMILNTRPDNPKAWADMAYYQRAIQPVVHAADSCQPSVVGTPIRLEGLRQRKIPRIDAKIHVNAEGTVTQVEVEKVENMSDKLHAMIADTFKQALYVPAVDHGKFVDGVFEYHVDLSQ